MEKISEAELDYVRLICDHEMVLKTNYPKIENMFRNRIGELIANFKEVGFTYQLIGIKHSVDFNRKLITINGYAEESNYIVNHPTIYQELGNLEVFIQEYFEANYNIFFHTETHIDFYKQRIYIRIMKNLSNILSSSLLSLSLLSSGGYL